MNVSSAIAIGAIAIGVMRSEPRPAAKRAMTLRREHAGIDCECARCDMACEEVQSRTVSLMLVRLLPLRAFFWRERNREQVRQSNKKSHERSREHHNRLNKKNAEKYKGLVENPRSGS